MPIALLRVHRCKNNSGSGPTTHEENIMGKYFLAWLLGVPAFVLVILYLFFN
jgi:hypothetical protein